MLQKEAPSVAFPAIAPLTSNANRRAKSVFIGETLGEHHNKPILKGKTWQYHVPTASEDRNLLKRALDIFRGRFGEKVGYGVFNLIEKLKIVREDLSGENFSGLDLSFVNFNGISLGRTTSDRTDFHGAKVSMKNLLCQGHSDWVTSVAFAPDGKTFLSGSSDGTIRVWSAETGKCLRVIQNYPGLIVFGCDMRNLHEGSEIDRDVLRQYGAMVD